MLGFLPRQSWFDPNLQALAIPTLSFVGFAIVHACESELEVGVQEEAFVV